MGTTAVRTLHATIALAATLLGFTLASASLTNPMFGIYVASRGGAGFALVTGTDDREMTHPRVSPDLRRVVFTRYTVRGSDGRATEAQGYEGTEVVMVNVDGTGLKTLVAAKAGIINANASWSPDGKSVYFLSTDNAIRIPEIHVYDLRTRAITRMPTPSGLLPTDPNRVANQVVFPSKRVDGTADPLWLMNVDGTNARQLTAPVRASSDPGYYGDFDPKLSPDGTRVAFMRIDGGNGWRVMTLEIAAMRETSLTPDGAIQGLPAWSSEGSRLVYTNLDTANPSQIGLFTMNADGTDRVKVPLPGGRLYSHAAWFPLEGASVDARLVFTGTITPGL